MSGDLTFEMGYMALVKRLDRVCAEILENPKFNEESRSKAVNQAAVYSLTLNSIAKEAGGELPVASKPIVESIIDFIQIVEGFCLANKIPVASKIGQADL